MSEYLPAIGIALFFWTMIDYRLHWLGILLTAWIISDILKGAFNDDINE